jgi:hypothetical protein
MGNFRKRHKEILSLRKTSQKTPGEMGVTEDQLKNFHRNLTESLEGVPQENILNMDETSLHWDE